MNAIKRRRRCWTVPPVRINKMHLPLRTDSFGILNPSGSGLLAKLPELHTAVGIKPYTSHRGTPGPCRKLFLLKLQLPIVIKAGNEFLNVCSANNFSATYFSHLWNTDFALWWMRGVLLNKSGNSLEVLIWAVIWVFTCVRMLCCDTAVVSNWAETELSLLQKEKWLLVEHFSHPFNFGNCMQPPWCPSLFRIASVNL